MNEVDLAASAPVLIVAETTTSPPVRDAMLSGAFVGNRDAALADTVSAFLNAEPGTAIDLWFGAESGARLRIDEQALRDSVDRDIAAIDALISEQLDAVLHHPRARRLEGSWRGLAWLVDNVE